MSRFNTLIKKGANGLRHLKPTTGCGKAAKAILGKFRGDKRGDKSAATAADTVEPEKFQENQQQEIPARNPQESQQREAWCRITPQDSLRELALPQDLFDELEGTRKAQVKMDSKAEVAQQKLDILRVRNKELRAEIQQLEGELGVLEPFQHHDGVDIISMRRRHWGLLDERAAILKERDVIQEETKQQLRNFGDRACALVDIWQEIYDEHMSRFGLQSTATETLGVDAAEAGVQEAASVSPAPNQYPGTPNSSPPPAPRPEHIPDKTDKTRFLVPDYEMLRRQLDYAEMNLETRHERFDREIVEGYERYQRKDPGWETERQIEHRHFRETQEMTRFVIEAEAELAEKKQELLRAGIQPPGSDIESGFVDDVDDGYLSSGEDDGNCHNDPHVLKWLEGVPGPAEDEYERLIAATKAAPRPKDIDPWPAREVEIWESASMVADGPRRRRIDNWRARAEVAGVQVEEPPWTSLKRWKGKLAVRDDWYYLRDLWVGV